MKIARKMNVFIVINDWSYQGINLTFSLSISIISLVSKSFKHLFTFSSKTDKPCDLK